MANINKINLYGTVYDIEDKVSRSNSENAITLATGAQETAESAQTTATQAQTTATQAQTTANQNKSDIAVTKQKVPVISYNEAKQQIEITRGV